MMNIFTGSPFLISLMSTLASLPFFLFALPAGALADKVDRKKLLCFINVGLASSDCLTLLANLLLVLVYVSMALVRQPEAFFVVAALAGVGWTMSASELWVATQRAIPSWARGRMNAAVIMISQGAMALGGLIWGWAATIAGPSSALLGAATLFLTSLLLSRRLSISVTTNFQESVSGYLCGCVEEVPPTTLTTELLAA